MEKRLLKNKEDWETLKKNKGENTSFHFQKEKKPKKYPCIAMYHFAEDVTFGYVYGVGFCYLDDFPENVLSLNLKTNDQKTINFSMMDIDEMDLPKVNERKQESKIKQTSLRLEIYKTIQKFEKDNDYKFEPYEVDNILLEMVKRNHELYLNTKFGYDTV